MIRVLIIIPCALLLTMTVFAFMTWLVKLDVRSLPSTDSALRFDVVQVEQESEAKRRQRRLPEPPQQQLAAPTQLLVSSAAPLQSIPLETITAPMLEIDNTVTGLAITPPILPELAPIKPAKNQQALPLYRIEPRYPVRAKKRNIEGYIVLQFTIDASGAPVEIKVLKSEPKGMFDKEAKRALKRWKYQPMITDGIATAQSGQTVRLEFTLQNE